jgi:hypothetical protein
LDEAPAHTLTSHHGRNSGEDFVASAGESSTSSEQTFALADVAIAFHCTQDPISAEEKTPLISVKSTGVIGVLPIQDSQRRRQRKQNGIGIGKVGDPMYTMTTRGDHAVFIASDGSTTETDCAQTIGTDANRPARTMTIALDYQQGGEGAGVVREEIAPTMGARADRAAVFAFDEVQITSAANRSTVSPGGPVPTVSKTSRLRVASADSLVPRRLTPMEVERCFGFPDGYTAIPGAADSPRYEALGNSMAVPVMRWIGRRLLMVDGIVRGK